MPTPATGTSGEYNTPVEINFNVLIEASGNLYVFGQDVSGVQNVIVASIELPVSAFYDASGNSNGGIPNSLFEFWEPSDALGERRATLSGKDASGIPVSNRDYTKMSKKFVLDLQSLLEGPFDCSGASPFNDQRYPSVYQTQDDFGRLALSTYAHYLFGHIGATSAITNDQEFMNAMLSKSRIVNGNNVYKYEYVSDIAGNGNGLTWNSDNGVGTSADADLARLLVGCILSKDNDAILRIVEQVIGQDASRAMDQDNNALAPGVRHPLKFIAGDTLYMNIKLQAPSITIGNGQLVDDATLITKYTAEENYTLEIKLTDASGSLFVGLPAIPTISSVIQQDSSLKVYFSTDSNTTEYQYSTDGGVNYYPTNTLSPYTITGLTNGTGYTVVIKAINAAGESISSGLYTYPRTKPDAPTIEGITGGDGFLDVAFSQAPNSDGGETITTYYYSVNDGAYINANTTTSPIRITGLTNGTTYTIRLKAYNAAGISTNPSASESGTPVSPSTGARGIAEWGTSLFTIQPGTTLDVKSSITDSSNNLYITGQYFTASTLNPLTIPNMDQTDSSITLPGVTTSSPFIIKYNSSGQAVWANNLQGVSGTSIGWGIARDSTNNIYITGQYVSTATTITITNATTSTSAPTATSPALVLPIVSTSSTFLIKYDTNGQAVWATYLNGSGTDIGYGITIDSQNSVYITGQYTQATGSVVNVYDAITSGTLSTTTTGRKLTLAAVGTTSGVCLIKYNSSGIVQWGTAINGSGSDVGLSIKNDTSNSVYITGYYNSSTAIPRLYNAVNAGSEGAPGAVDPSGASSVITLRTTGTANDTMFLAKYSVSGAVQRATVIDCSGGATVIADRGTSLAIDSANNVYVTGFYGNAVIDVSGVIYNSIASGTTWATNTNGITLPKTLTASAAMFLVKYNSDLTAQWATALDASGISSLDQGNAVAVDSANNVYVAGNSTISNPITILDASGTTQKLSSITLASSTINGNTTRAAFLIKYDSNGQSLWATSLNGTDFDQSTTLCIDSNNDVYMSGYYVSYTPITIQNASGNGQTASSITLPLGPALFVVKYNSSGSAQAATSLRCVGPTSSFSSVETRSVMTDLSNNVYIGGTYLCSSSNFIYVMNKDKTASSILLPSSNGSVGGFLIKYDPSGMAVWATPMNNLVNSATTLVSVFSIGVDSNNDVYICGGYYNTTAVSLFNAITTGSSYGSSVATLPASTASTLYDLFLIKYTSSGVYQWRTTINGAGTDSAYQLDTDSLNNIYIAGNYSQSTGPITLNHASGSSSGKSLPAVTSNSSLLIKYSSIGNVEWATSIGSQSSAGGTVVDSSNNVYIGGYYASTSNIQLNNASGSSSGISLLATTSSSNRNMYLVKYDPSGSVQWATNIQTNNTNIIVYALTKDTLDNIYITGRSTITSPVALTNASGSSSDISLPITSGQGVILVKYDSNGNVGWGTYIDSSGSQEQGYSICTDSFNNVYLGFIYTQTSSALQLYDVSGTTFSPSLVSLPFTSVSNLIAGFVKYNSNGKVQWATYLNGIDNLTDNAYGVSIDSNNNLYVVGSFYNPTDLTINNVDEAGTGQTPSSLSIVGVSSGLTASNAASAGFLIKYS